MIIDLQNKHVLSILDGVIDTWFSKAKELNIDFLAENVLWVDQETKKLPLDQIEYRVSEEVLRNEYLPTWQDHSGYPSEHRSTGIHELMNLYPEEYRAYHDYVRFELSQELGCASNALFSYYPPHGIVGWHTNWNAYSYQVLFTWSENGDGYFTYYDKENDKVIKVQDKPGWNAKTYYFAPIEEDKHHCWHACYAGNSGRLTLCYKFTNWGGAGTSRDKAALDWRNDFVEYLETP